MSKCFCSEFILTLGLAHWPSCIRTFQCLQSQIQHHRWSAATRSLEVVLVSSLACACCPSHALSTPLIYCRYSQGRTNTWPWVLIAGPGSCTPYIYRTRKPSPAVQHARCPQTRTPQGHQVHCILSLVGSACHLAYFAPRSYGVTYTTLRPSDLCVLVLKTLGKVK